MVTNAKRLSDFEAVSLSGGCLRLSAHRKALRAIGVKP